MAKPRIVYEDIAPGGAEQTTVSVSSKQPFSNPQGIVGELAVPQAATLEQDYWILGSGFKFFPDNPNGYEWGWWSAAMCGEDGAFTAPPVLTLSMDGYFTCVGLTFTFDPYGPTFPTDINIRWYRDNTLLYDLNFTPTGHQYSAIQTVQLFNRIEIMFRRMSHGYRYVKLQGIIYGITRTFGTDELGSASFYQSISLISDELEVSDLVFDIHNNTDAPFTFQRKQELQVLHGDHLLGIRFITRADQMAANHFKITAQDWLGLLQDSGDHKGGLYTGQLSGVLLADIIGSEIPVIIEDGLDTVPVRGWLPMGGRIDNLTQVLFAIGGCVSTARQRELHIFKPKTSANAVPLTLAGRQKIGTRLTTGKVLTGVQVTEHSFTVGTDTIKAFDDILNGQTTVTFSEPICAVSISTGGTILEWGANYAVISGNGSAITLTATRYNHSTRVLTRDNTLIESGTVPNVKKCTDAYLIGAHNSAEVLERYYNHYLRNVSATAPIYVDTDKVGDLVRLEPDFYGERVGNIQTMDINLSKKLAADIRVLLEAESV